MPFFQQPKGLTDADGFYESRPSVEKGLIDTDGFYKSQPAQALNANKIIKLYRFGKPNKTWKTTIATIFQDINNAQEKKADKFMFPTSGVNVEPGIELLMTDDPEKFKNSFGTTTPVKTFFDKITTATGKYGQYAKTIVETAAQVTNAVNAITNSFSEGTGYQTSRQLNPWVAGAPSWDGNLTPLNFSYNFTFSMGQYGLWDAKKEVMIPAFNLIAPVFPQYLDAAYVAGPIPNAMNFATNLISALTTRRKERKAEKEANKDTTEDDETTMMGAVANYLDELLLGAYENFLWDIDFGGHLKFKRCIIKGGDLEFSKETDDQGYPVYAKVHLEFTSMLPPALSADSSKHQAMRFGD